jgi:hypothetical protein
MIEFIISGINPAPIRSAFFSFIADADKIPVAQS